MALHLTTVIVEGPAGTTIVSPEAPSNEEIVAETTAKVPEAQDTENVRPKATAEAPDAATAEVNTAEVNTAEVAPKVEAKGAPAPATKEAKLEAKESKLLIVVDVESAAPEEEPAGNKAKLTGTTTSVEGRMKDSVSGPIVTVTAEIVDAEIGVTAVAPLSDTFLIAECPRLAIFVWLGGWGLTSVVVS
jgi:hypothetical protein